MTVALPDLTDHVPGPACTLCGRPMDPEQEWCLECGAARTRIVAPPDWRIPLLVIAVVLALIVGGLAFALSRLTASAGQQTVITSPAGATAAAEPAGWPPGLDGYTVILAEAHSRRAADAIARRDRAAHVAQVGVLATDAHPEMLPRHVLYVFTGRYPSYALARIAAARLRAHGQPAARPDLVQRPGQS